MSVLDLLCGDLKPTATYARRSWVWMPTAGRYEQGDDRVGTLTIVQQKSRRAGAKQESDSYAVVEESAFGYPGGRLFLLMNETDDTQEDVYRCVVGGPGEHCTCTAGNCKVGHCKHRSSLAAIIAEGGL